MWLIPVFARLTKAFSISRDFVARVRRLVRRIVFGVARRVRLYLNRSRSHLSALFHGSVRRVLDFRHTNIVRPADDQTFSMRLFDELDRWKPGKRLDA